MTQHKTQSFSKSITLICLGVFLLSARLSLGQTIDIHPVPQEVKMAGDIPMPAHFKLDQRNTDDATKQLLNSFFDDNNQAAKGFSISIGDVNQKFPKNLRNKVPKQAEGYYINSTNKGISVIGRDARGVYYGVRTLIDLLSSEKMPLGDITDYPDVSARGVVEGFYGTPWSFEHRIRQIDFYGLNKLNTYIYGPKDDPYHSSPNWRKPYPEDEAVKIKKLIDRAHLNQVDFVWAAHPGQDIKWNDEDRKNLLHKFELMYDLGVRSYAIFFDDISGEGTNPSQQAGLLNYLNDEFVKKKKDVNPLILCPTEYNKSWSNVEGGYLSTLGKELDPSIRIMWTGNKVVADIDKETMNWINNQIQRKAFIWWNFPVSDYVRNHLLMGPTYGNGLDIADDISGFVSNPMEHAEASKIAIYGVGDYTWNMTAYNSEQNWQNAMKVVMPESYKALEIFASHNSDLGPNGHGYRRDESVHFKPTAEAFLKQLQSGAPIANYDAVRNEFQAMVEASYILLNSTDNSVLLDEIRPWVKQFQLLGQSGLTMLNMYDALKEKNSENFEQSYNALKAMKVGMYTIDQNENQNPYQPGVKTGTLVVQPLIDESVTYLTKSYNKAFDKHLEIQVDYNPHALFSNIDQLKNKPILLPNRTISLNPPLEVIKIQPQEYFGFELEKTTKVKNIVLTIAPNSVYENINIEVSTNGTDWTTLTTKTDILKLLAPGEHEAKYIRVINSSSNVLEGKIERFSVQAK